MLLKASICSISIYMTKKLYVSGTLGDRTFSTSGLNPIRTHEPLNLMNVTDMIHTWTKSLPNILPQSTTEQVPPAQWLPGHHTHVLATFLHHRSLIRGMVWSQ